MLGRYSSAIRAACAKERSCGSARGAISDVRPYRDRQLSDANRTNRLALISVSAPAVVEHCNYDR